jgi:hypothetical protein
MQLLRRVVQFCLGMEAVGMIGSFALQLFTLYTLKTQMTDDDLPPYAYTIMTMVALILPVLGAIPTMAWWTLRNSKPSARRWTLAAGVLNILVMASGIQAAILMSRYRALPIYFVCGSIGVLSLIAFRRKDAVAHVPTTPPKVIRLSGDGTSTAKDYTSQVVSFTILWLSFHYWRLFSDAQGLEQPGFVVGLLLFQVAIVLNTFFHELGHYVAGWASGMVLRRFQVGPFQWAIRNGRWNFEFRIKEFYGGAVGMVTPTLDNIRGREAFLIMGGPMASLAVGAIATTAALGAKGHAWEPYWAFLSMCAAMGWASFVTNLIPLKSAARYSDGAQLYQLVKGGEWAHFHIAFAMVASSLVTPIRPRDFNVSTINRAADFITQGERGLLLRLFACIHYLDAGRLPEALASMQAAETLYEQSVFEKPQDICAEFVFINAFHKRDLAAAELWWRRIESLGKIERDADFWRARTALLWLRGEREEARDAWEHGNALAQSLPAVGVYEGTRACFAKLRAELDAPVATAPPSLAFAPILVEA